MLNKIKSILKKMLTILYQDNILSIRTMVFEKYTRKYISQAPFLFKKIIIIIRKDYEIGF